MKSLSFRRKYGVRRFGRAPRQLSPLFVALLASIGVGGLLHASSSFAQIVFGDSTVSAGVTSQAQLLEDGTQSVYGTAISQTLYVSAFQAVLYGGVASETLIQAGTGDAQYVSSGGTAISTVVQNDGLVEIYGGAASFTTVQSGGSEVVYGGESYGANVQSGGLQAISGGVASNAMISSGGQQIVLGGGVAMSASVLSGGAEYVSASGMASHTLVSAGGGQMVLSGGSAVETAVLSGGSEEVDAGGAASRTTVSSGGSLVVNGDAMLPDVTLAPGAIWSATTLATLNGTNALGSSFTISNGVASGVLLEGQSVLEVVSGTSASASRVEGGSLRIDAGGVAYDTVVFDTSVVTVSGTTSGTVLSSGGEYLFGTGYATEILSGSVELIFTGASAFNDIVSSGAIQTNFGGVAISTVVAGGTQQVFGGTTTGTIIDSGGVGKFYSATSATETTVNSGGALIISSGARANTTTVASGATLQVSSSGSATNINATYGFALITTADATLDGQVSATAGAIETFPFSIVNGSASFLPIASGGVLQVSGNGRVASSTLVWGGGELDVASGGRAIATDLGSGGVERITGSGSLDLAGTVLTGQQIVQDGGVASSVAFAYGGTEIISSGGVASNVGIFAGGSQFVSAGGIANGTLLLGLRWYADGYVPYDSSLLNTPEQVVLSGGVANSTVISSGGTATIREGGAANDALVYASGTLTVSSGGTASGTTVSSGGLVDVFADGTALATVIDSGGDEEVYGTESGTTVLFSGLQHLNSGATATATMVNSGGAQRVEAGAVASQTNLAGGATLYVSSGATATAVVQSSGATLMTTADAYLDGTNALGTFSVSNGSAMNLLIEAGGSLEASGTGRVASNTTVFDGGNVYVVSGGESIDTNVGSGGTESVFGSGAMAVDAIVQTGRQIVLAGGVTSDSQLAYGGLQTVGLNGVANETTVYVGGTQTVDAGAIANETILTSASIAALSGTPADYGIVTTPMQNVSSGGIANATYIGVGTVQAVMAGGLANDTVVAGGTQTVGAGAVASRTELSVGSAVINGTAVDLSMGDNGLLTGTGVIGSDLIVTAGSVLAADTVNSGLTINGNLTLQAGSLYRVALNASTQESGLTQVAGNVTIDNGAALTMQSVAGQYAAGANNKYTIMTYGGTQTGAFSTVNTDFAYVTPTISYANNAITVSLLVNGTTGTGTTGTGPTGTGGTGTGTTGTGTTGTGTAGTGTTGTGTTGTGTTGTGTTGTGTTGTGTTITGTTSTVTTGKGSTGTGTTSTVTTGTSATGTSTTLTGTTGTGTADTGTTDTDTSTTATPSVNFSSVASQTNQRSVGDALSQVYAAGGNRLTDVLLTATTTEAREALTAMSGEEAVAMRQIAEGRMTQAQDVVASRLRQDDADVSGGAFSATPAGRLTAANVQRDLWVQASYQNARTGSDDASGAPAYIDRSAALTIGHDRAIDPNWRVGAAVMLNDDTIHYEQSTASARVDGAQALLYGAFTPVGSPFYVNALASYGWWDNTVSRQVNLGVLSGSPRATFSTSGQSLYAETGMKLPSSVGLITPYVGAKVGRYAQQGYAESTSAGSDVFDLRYDKRHTTSAASVLGVRLAQGGATLFGYGFHWQVDLSWQHRFGATQNTVDAAFVDTPGYGYQISGNRIDRDAFRSTVGGEWALSKRTSVYANVAASLGSTTKAYGGNAGVIWKW